MSQPLSKGQLINCLKTLRRKVRTHRPVLKRIAPLPTWLLISRIHKMGRRRIWEKKRDNEQKGNAFFIIAGGPSYLVDHKTFEKQEGREACKGQHAMVCIMFSIHLAHRGSITQPFYARNIMAFYRLPL